MDKLTRRDFLKAGILFLPALYGIGKFPNYIFSQNSFDIVEVEGKNIKNILKEGLKYFGGMKNFVKPKDKVIIKPNISWSMPPEEAVNTNPELLKAVIEECQMCKPDKILVLDHTVRFPGIAFAKNGAISATKDTTAQLRAINSISDYVKVDIKKAKVLQKTDIAKDILDTDVVINIPIAKVHGGAGVTFSMKNLMGLVWDRGYFHKTDLHQTIVDLAEYLKPKLKLTILDAIRILKTNGPGGPGEVEIKNKIILGVDFVAVDSYGCTLFNIKPEEIGHISIAGNRKLGKANLKEIEVKSIKI